MVFSDKEILEWGFHGGVKNFDGRNVNPASLDLRLGDGIRTPMWYWNPVTRPIVWALRKYLKSELWSPQRTFGKFTLWPGQFVLCHALEWTDFPAQAIGMLFSKSSTGRVGLEHLHAGYVDNSFRGQLTLELHNVAPWPIEMIAGKRLMQVVLIETKSVPDKLYGEVGHYQDQTGATPARKDF